MVGVLYCPVFVYFKSRKVYLSSGNGVNACLGRIVSAVIKLNVITFFHAVLFLFFVFLFLFYLPYLSSIHEKANCIAILGREVRTRLGVAFFEVYGPPVFHIKVGRPVKCLAQGHNKRTCRFVLHNLP